MTQVKSDLKSQAGVDTELDCGKAKLEVHAVGEKISCTATAGGVSQKIEATVTDVNGTIDLATV